MIELNYLHASLQLVWRFDIFLDLTLYMKYWVTTTRITCQHVHCSCMSVALGLEQNGRPGSYVYNAYIP